MRTNVGADEVVAHIASYLQRAASGRERFVALQDGSPVAAIVGAEDLARLETLGAEYQGGPASTDREAAFRQALREAGLVVQWPSGPAVPLHERMPLPIEGPPLSEQIIADRR